jgi:short-subunit dehydrogenase
MYLPPVTHRSVCITGCSTGIGKAAAYHLRDRGWQVVPTARRDEDLAALRAAGFTPVAMDMADPDSVATGAAAVLAQTDGKLGALVNNAGFGQSGALEDLQRSHIEYQFQVNVFGLQDLTNRFIPIFRQQGFGRIVHISSVVGRISVPFLGCYSASKFAVEALADAQRVELTDSGVGVLLVEPGPIITDFRKTASKRAFETLDTEQSRFGRFYQQEIRQRVERQKKPDWINGSSEQVAVLIERALTAHRPRRRYRITPAAHAGEWMRKLPAALLDTLFAQQLRRRHQLVGDKAATQASIKAK